MAYIGPEVYLAAWVAGVLKEDTLSESCIHLLGSADSPEEGEVPASEPSQGFIIRDWFGPFLLGPPSRFMRGRC